MSSKYNMRQASHTSLERLADAAIKRELFSTLRSATAIDAYNAKLNYDTALEAVMVETRLKAKGD